MESNKGFFRGSGGDFKDILCSPRKLEKDPILADIFQRRGSTTNQMIHPS